MKERRCSNCTEYSGSQCWADLPPWAVAYTDKNNRPPVKPDDGRDCALFEPIYEGN